MPEADPAAPSLRDAHRAPRRAPALGRAPGVEDLKAARAAVLGQMGVAEDHCVRGGKCRTQPLEPSRHRTGVVNDADDGALYGELEPAAAALAGRAAGGYRRGSRGASLLGVARSPPGSGRTGAPAASLRAQLLELRLDPVDQAPDVRHLIAVGDDAEIHVPAVAHH